MRILTIFILLLTLYAGCRKEQLLSQTSPPNVIIILTDDQGYKDVGFNGCEDIPTPNIDRIAEQGVKFTSGYVSYAVCGPSRAGLITGRYQDRFGFGRNPLFAPNDPDQGLPVSEETIAAALKKAGYSTMAIGKWHLGAHESQRPLNRGFDEFFGFLTGGHQYFPELWTLNDISEVDSQFAAYKTKLLRNNQRIDEQEYLTDALSREAVSFVDKNANQPFFLYLAYNAPHAPLQATEKYLNRFGHISDGKRKKYAAMVSSVDDGVGALLDKLQELNIDKNTLVVFLSDNGGPHTKNGSNNDPLRDGKGSLHEGGIRVPFAMQWPAKLKAGQVYDQPVISLDIFAIAAEYAGVQPKNKLDGVNIIPFINEEKTGVPHEQLFWRKFDSNSFAVRASEMKLVSMNGGAEEIYNIETDISEKTPLNDVNHHQNLKNASDDWKSQLMNPIFLGLRQNEEYNDLHPDRFVLDKY